MIAPLAFGNMTIRYVVQSQFCSKTAPTLRVKDHKADPVVARIGCDLRPGSSPSLMDSLPDLEEADECARAVPPKRRSSV